MEQLDDRKVFRSACLAGCSDQLALRPDLGGDSHYWRLCPVVARNPNARISRKVSFVTIVRNLPAAA
jgi:hypothetical protein